MKDIQFLIYRSAEDEVSIKPVIKDENIWLTQKNMAELFDCSSDNISLHLQNIYDDGELLENATAEEISVVRQEGNRQPSFREIRRKVVCRIGGKVSD